jgi:hypothetical protein
MKIKELLNKRTLVVGGIKSGKTHFTCVFVKKILEEKGETIVVLDFAPNLFRGVGGKMILPEHPRLHYVTTRIDAPRLWGKDNADIQKLAEGNRCRIEKILDLCQTTHEDVLVINDATLYLQAGSCERLITAMAGFPTVLINAYYGSDFDELPFSRLEREKVERFMGEFDQVVRMDGCHIAERWDPSERDSRV